MLHPIKERVTKHYYGKEERHTPVESLEHDGVLSAEVIRWERVGLPAEPLVSIGQVLGSRNIGTELERQRAGGCLTHLSRRETWSRRVRFYTVPGFYLDVGLLKVVGPSGEQVLPHLLLKVAGVGDERRREQTVSGDGGHLVLEGLAGLLPAVAFSGQTLQEGRAAVDLRRRWARE